MEEVLNTCDQFWVPGTGVDAFNPYKHTEKCIITFMSTFQKADSEQLSVSHSL